jgi:nitrogen regulatory protein PII-like uncharacterized protein
VEELELLAQRFEKDYPVVEGAEDKLVEQLDGGGVLQLLCQICVTNLKAIEDVGLNPATIKRFRRNSKKIQSISQWIQDYAKETIAKGKKVDVATQVSKERW